MAIPLETLERIRSGDTMAFAALVRDYQACAYALAARLLWREDEAEDVVQEAFVRVWQNIHRYDPSVRFTTWLYRIVTNLCIDHLRARKRRIPNWSTNTDDEPESAGPDPLEQASRGDLLAIIKSLAEQLPSTQRLVFLLRDLQDLSIDEVAQITGLSEASIKTNLHYARRRLRDQLSREYGIEGGS
jgi:RNA polymerase sigma-70 factor (ECF subfamily)